MLNIKRSVEIFYLFVVYLPTLFSVNKTIRVQQSPAITRVG